MKVERALVVTAVGIFGSGGLGARHAAFGHLAQQTCIHVGTSMKGLEDQRMAALPQEILPVSHPDLRVPGGYTDHYCRMLCLADHALREAAQGDVQATTPLPLFIALPQQLGQQPWTLNVATLCAHLSLQTGVSLDASRSVMFARGRAGAFFALAAAADYLRQHGGQVYVGGLDSYIDPDILAALRGDQRLSGEGVNDGFIPGEGAAFVRLAWRPAGLGEVVLAGVGLGHERGHRFSNAPYEASGLSDAMAAMRQADAPPAAKTVLAGLTGEHFDIKAWRVAWLRQTALFAAGARIETPVESTGCLGAALGAHLLALAVTSLRYGLLPGPILSWAASDLGCRGVATVALHQRHKAVS